MSLLEEFVDFLAEHWSENPPPLHPGPGPDIEGAIVPAEMPTGCSYRPWHWFPITRHACWKPWKAGGQSTCSLALPGQARTAHWWCASLREASEHYSWTHSPHGTFPSLGAKLRGEMVLGNIQAVASTCHKIYDWGGVGRDPTGTSRMWVDNHAAAGTLIAALECAVALLQPGATTLGGFAFQGVDMPMNSATTKLFAAADPAGAILIFDGRVGAALCLLARRFLELRGVAGPVPLDLVFYWGPHASIPGIRDPSTPQFSFRNINQVSNLQRSQASQRANRVAQLLQAKAGVAPEDLERALFMVGYTVNT